MDNRLLIGFFVFLAAFLVLPVVMQQIRQSQTGEGPSGATGAAQSAPSKSVSEIPELNEPPLLNESNLIGSEWQVQVEQYKIKITVAAGGVLYATHPLAKAITGMDYLEGRWRIEYDKFHVSTSFGGREYSTTLKISGSNMYYIEGNKFEKVQRFQ